jgi:hypothetical protein
MQRPCFTKCIFLHVDFIWCVLLCFPTFYLQWIKIGKNIVKLFQFNLATSFFRFQKKKISQHLAKILFSGRFKILTFSLFAWRRKMRFLVKERKTFNPRFRYYETPTVSHHKLQDEERNSKLFLRQFVWMLNNVM